MSVLEKGKYYEDLTYNEQFQKVMNGTLISVPDEVPDPTVADNGKVLKVVEGQAAWADETVELPVSVSADEDKVLTVDSEGAPKWASVAHPAQFVVDSTEPTDTTVLWVDTTVAETPVLKVYLTDAWVAVSTV